jgi:uncharacterized protein (DUF2249 family)
MIDAHSQRPVSAADKVSEVLARDESLVDVFVRHAPHFGKLRNRAMRRVMARLVTVEQAARTAGVSADRLIHDLNDALGIVAEPIVEASEGVTDTRTSSGSARRPLSAATVEVDVRDDLRAGREPFSRIMSAVSALGAGEVLHLRALFEPAPLYTVLGKRGLVHESEAHAPDDWSVWFWRPASGEVAPVENASAAAPVAGAGAELSGDDEHTTHLDVRGLHPPEPLMRTLAALESLPAGRTLVQINDRVPRFLLPVLSERGFAWEIDESRPDRVLVRISHVR